MTQDKLPYLPAEICSNPNFQLTAFPFVWQPFSSHKFVSERKFNVFIRLQKQKEASHFFFCCCKLASVLAIDRDRGWKYYTLGNIVCYNFPSSFFLVSIPQRIDFEHAFLVDDGEVCTIIKKFKGFSSVVESCWHERRVKVFTELFLWRSFYCQYIARRGL